MASHLVAIVILLSLSAFGFKSLHLFATSNGLLTHLEKCITDGKTPGGKPLRTLTTNDRFPAIDLQLRAVAVFLLIFCEDLEHPDADVVGFSFAANWGASWILIVSESLREYSRDRFMSWITIPGIVIFNQSNAVFTPLYLAIRLGVAASSNSPDSLSINPANLAAIPESFLWGYLVPLFAMAMPGIVIRGTNTKHAISSWYQQWNLYISLVHLVLVNWSANSFLHSESLTKVELLISLRPVYLFAMALASASLWVPLLSPLAANLFGSRNSSGLDLRNVLLPPSPWSKVRCANVFEGGKWLLQWDGIIGSLGSAVWAIALLNDARAAVAPDLPMATLILKASWYMLLGGPMGVATGMLWERDALVLSGQTISLI